MKRTTVILSAIIALAACSKKKDIATPQPTPAHPVDSMVYPSYSMLQTGNYWVYSYHRVDRDGTETQLPHRDSVYVAKDTIMNGYTWHEIRRTTDNSKTYEQRWQRDSLHYIVDYYGGIQFSSADFKTVFKSKYMVSETISPEHDSVGLVEIKMGDRRKMVTVPAGTFTTSAMLTTWHFHPYFSRYGLTSRSEAQRYSPGIGLVSEQTFYIFDPAYFEKRLASYKVK